MFRPPPVSPGIVVSLALAFVATSIGGCLDAGEPNSTQSTSDTRGSRRADASTSRGSGDTGDDAPEAGMSRGSDDDETEDACIDGDERCPCYPNQTCNGDLTCLSGVCVDASEFDDDGDAEPIPDEEQPAESSNVPDGGTSNAPVENADMQDADVGAVDDAPDEPGSLATDDSSNEESTAEAPPGTSIDAGQTDPDAPSLDEGTSTPTISDLFGDSDPMQGEGDAPSTPPSALGSSCTADIDCGDGLHCMLEGGDDWFDGGPANGYCTADCLADAGACRDLDPDALCLQTSDTTAWCVAPCALGAVAKCHDRGDVACDAASIGPGFCRPMCRSDADCGGGRACDLGIGTCIDEPLTGDPIGTQCDPDVSESNCASRVCLPITEEFAVCSGFCNLSEVGCGSDSLLPADPGQPICTFSTAQGGSAGDLGFCNQRCYCDDDCLHPDALCLILPEDLFAVFGSDGICVDPEFPVEDSSEFILGRECE